MAKTTAMMLLTIIAMASAKVCKKDVVTINALAGEAKFDHGKPTLTYVSAKRTKITAITKIRMMFTTRKYMYCLPKIVKDESPKCRDIVEPIDYSKEEMLDSLNSAKCLVGETCNEYGCRGEKASYCLEPRLTKKVRNQELPAISKATSLLHSTCVQYWGCNIEEKEINLHLQSDGTLRADDPTHGEFVFRSSSDLYARGKMEGRYAMIMFPIHEENDVVQLTCLKESNSHICLDENSRKVMTISKTGTTCVGNMCFKCDEKSLDFEEEPQSLGEIPTQFDMVRMYRLLQYQGIQTLWDLSQVHSRAQQIEKVLGKVIEVLTLNNTELISYLTGLILSKQTVDGGSIVASVCRAGHEEEEALKSIAQGNNIVFWDKTANISGGSTARLFWSGSVLDNEVPRPKFEVDKLTYSDIARLEGSSLGSGNAFDSGRASVDNSWFENTLLFLKNMGSVLGWLSALSILFGYMRR